MSLKKRRVVPQQEAKPGEPSEKWIITGCAVIYAMIVLWGLLSQGTWDDDCPARYYFVRHALSDPNAFISVWNRPLFTLLYVLPIQLGRISVVFQTALIAVLAGYFIYRAAKELNLPNAYLAIPFTALQTFFFPVAFNALTEPLAALVLSLMVFFAVRRHYLAFAIAGSFLPLARLELSVLLAIGAFFLLREKQWRYIPILAIPAILWNFAGTLSNGDPLWLYHAVFTGQENRYGHGSFWQYPQRFIYLTGPIIFYFFMLGFFERLYRRNVDFLLLNFLIGFSIYIVFSWILSVGQAAGFLRNLLPLSPLAALIALEGYNLWVGQPSDRQRSNRVLLFSGVVILLTILFFSRKLVIHHIVGDEPEYGKLEIIGLLTLILIVVRFLVGENSARKASRLVLPTLIIGGSLAYTLITEPPIGLIPERAVMSQVADWYERNHLPQFKTYVNHIWFFYAKEYDYFDEEHFGRVTMANLEQAPKSSVVIWESHYAHRLFGDVQMSYFQNNANFKEIGRFLTPDRTFGALIFQKQ